MFYNLIDLYNGKILGKLNNNQLIFLMDNFNVDDLYNTDFYVSKEDLESMKEEEPEENTIKILEKALGGREEGNLGIEPLTPNSKYKFIGKLINEDTKDPIRGALVKVINEDILGDDFIGYCYSKEDGTFKVDLDESGHNNFLKRKKEKKSSVYLEISLLQKGYDREWYDTFVKKEMIDDHDFGEIELSLDDF